MGNRLEQRPFKSSFNYFINDEDFLKWRINCKFYLNYFLKDGKPLFGAEGQQEAFHFWILIICGLCVPIMLLPKPILTYLNAQKKQKGNHVKLEEEVIFAFINFIV